MGLCGASSLEKEDLQIHLKQRDPFSWTAQKKVEKKKPVVVAQVKKKIEKAPVLSWQVCGVSLSTDGKYALFSHGTETKVVKIQQELCSGWKVEKITQASVKLKHSSGEWQEILL
jgi:Tfp pilus assembly protein PilP